LCLAIQVCRSDTVKRGSYVEGRYDLKVDGVWL
jgi:hypothetical protein